jgi:uncharacterized protein (UPF0333 family)
METWMIGRFLPQEARSFLAVAGSMKAQGSLEYIMMVAAAIVVIVIALAMVVKMKGTVSNSIGVNGVNMSITSAISNGFGS